VTRNSQIAALAGLLPVLAANAAFLVNVHGGLEGCFPYWDGCYSVSGGVRSGPGLWIFKWAALPTALLMAWCWLRTAEWLERGAPGRDTRTAWITGLGVAGAAFFLVYALWLGTDGEIYRWMRRYGVVFYFAFTALAQLLLASVLWKRRLEMHGGAARVASRAYLAVVVLMWILGVASAFKRKLTDDPSFLDRVENALEWDFALAMSLVFLALAAVFRAAERGLSPGDGR